MLAVPVLVSAQISNISGTGNQVLKVNKYVDVDGTPYLYADWRPGTVTDNLGKKFTNVFIKYDAYSDAVEVNQNGEVMILNGQLYPSFTIMLAEQGSNSVTVHNFNNTFPNITLPESGYFEILVEGNIRLFKKYKVKFIEDNVANYGTTAIVKRFQMNESIFMVTDGGIQNIKLNSKAVLNVLGEKSKPAEEFIKKEKIKIKTEADLIRLINYLNKL